jgi:pyridoxamine 5'-phosphate oxidase
VTSVGAPYDAAMTDPRRMQAPSGFHDDHPLERDDLLDDPLAQFRRWLGDAERAGVPLPNAMALATADAHGRPSVRHGLLLGGDEHGFQFFTNRHSRKGRQLAENPRAALVFLWKQLDRQVEVEGPVTELSDGESDAYFAARPRDAQLGAWASAQSEPIVGRGELEARLAEVAERFPDAVPRPPHWGGYALRPDAIEFWQGRRHRLHDRFRYTADADRWRVERLAP